MKMVWLYLVLLLTMPLFKGYGYASAQNIGSNWSTVKVTPAKGHGAPVISAKLDGRQEVRLLIDTGTSVPTIADTLVEKLGLSRRHLFRADGQPELFLGLPAEYTTVTSTQIGELSLADIPYMLMPASVLSRMLEEPVHGFIGSAFMLRFAVQFDLEKGEIKVLDGVLTETARAKLKDEGYVRIPMERTGRHQFALRVNINECKAIPVLIDSGAPRTTITREVAESLNLVPIGRGVKYSGLTRVPFETAKIDRLDLGPLSFKDLRIDYPEKGTSTVPRLGLDVLGKCRFVIDTPTLSFWVIPFSRPQ